MDASLLPGRCGPDGPVKGDFFECGRTAVPRRRGDFHFRCAILQRVKDKLGRHFVGSILGINKLEFIGPGAFEGETS